MQILDYTNDKSISSWQDDSGSYIRGFLISTKSNKNNWKIKDTSRVQDFVGKDFAVIPNRIGDKSKLDGHVVGTKDQVLKTYSDNSYGKITKVLGPFPYNDGTNDVYFEHITKLHNDKVASALMQHGAGTLTRFATSPHIFAYEGDDTNGWHGWEPAGLVLVSNPAFGEQSVITKSCHGQEIKCYQELAPENKIAAVTQLLSSLVNSADSVGYNNMSSTDTTSTTKVAEGLNDAAKDLSSNSLQTQETKQQVEQQPTKIITDQDTITNSQPTQQETSEELKNLRQKIAEMENEKKNEILQSMFEVYQDEKERDRLIKEISKANDLQTIKYLKGWVDILAPLYQKKGETEIAKQFKEQQDKELAALKKNKIASATSYKFQLPGEPKEPAKEAEQESNKIASTKKSGSGELADFISLIRGGLKA